MGRTFVQLITGYSRVFLWSTNRAAGSGVCLRTQARHESMERLLRPLGRVPLAALAESELLGLMFLFGDSLGQENARTLRKSPQATRSYLCAIARTALSLSKIFASFPERLPIVCARVLEALCMFSYPLLATRQGQSNRWWYRARVVRPLRHRGG